MPLYFAYGSNLNPRQMKERCPSAEAVGTARLLDHRLAFCGWSSRWNGGVATVLPEKGSYVPGVVYRLSAEDIETLDSCEGAPNFYRRVRVQVELDEGGTVEVETYVLEGYPENAPSVAYVETIREGYEHFGLDTSALDAALARSRGSSMEAPNALFVYGTLKRGFANHRLVSHAREMLKAKTKGTLYELPYGYPAMTLDGDGIVYGELMIFDNIRDVLSATDWLEDYRPDDPDGSLFVRVVIEVELEDKRKMRAWTYIAGGKLKDKLPKIGRVIKDGNWKG